MAIRFRRGLQAALAQISLLAGEPAYCTDTHKLMMGRGNGTNDLVITEAQLEDAVNTAVDAAVSAALSTVVPWTNLTLNSGISIGTYGGTPQYRKIGDIVYACGGVTGISGPTIIATLPTGYRPQRIYYHMGSGTGNTVVRWSVGTSGEIKVDWSKTVGGADSYNLTWYAFSFYFSVN